MRPIVAGFFIAFCVGFFTWAEAQEIVSNLRLGRNEPKPIWFEYSPLDEGLVTVGAMSRENSKEMGLFKYDNTFKRQWQVTLFMQNGKKGD